MNWCYYFINLQQKAIFSKNWGGPEKDRFFWFFSGFFLFFLDFFKVFLFSRGLHFCFFLLYSFFSSSFFSSSSCPSIVVPRPVPQCMGLGSRLRGKTVTPLPLSPLPPPLLILLLRTIEWASRGRTTATLLWSSPRGSSPQGSPARHRGHPELYLERM